MVLRFDQVELGFVFVVIVGNVLIGNVDARSDFLVQYLVLGERPMQVTLEVVERYFLVLKVLVEFFGGIGRFDFVQSAVDFLVGCQQAEFLGTLHQDFRRDQFVQNAQAEAHGLLAYRLLIGTGRLVGVILV